MLNWSPLRSYESSSLIFVHFTQYWPPAMPSSLLHTLWAIEFGEGWKGGASNPNCTLSAGTIGIGVTTRRGFGSSLVCLAAMWTAVIGSRVSTTAGLRWAWKRWIYDSLAASLVSTTHLPPTSCPHSPSTSMSSSYSQISTDTVDATQSSAMMAPSPSTRATLPTFLFYHSHL